MPKTSPAVRAPRMSPGRALFHYWIPLSVWLFFMFLFSTDSFSSAETSRFIGPLLSFLFPGLSASQLYFWHGVIRKIGHVTEYFVLTILTYRTLRYERGMTRRVAAVSFCFVFMIAAADEYHQSLTMYRDGSIFDVGYDGLGGLAALGLVRVLRK